MQVDGATHQSTGKAFLLLSNTQFSLCLRQNSAEILVLDPYLCTRI